jgi:15-cis-phytoene synthase
MNSLAKPWSKLTLSSEGSAASAIIRRHSKSFALASKLLPSATRGHSHALYAYCRRADDAVDLTTPAQAPGALERLRVELDAVYAGDLLTEPIASEFQRVVFERRIPRAYPEALLDGFELDVRGTSYATLFDLHHYCWCVAGSVGAMMCHVMGVRRESAVVHGAHLGMGMQLTNICRDIAEDWARGRLYVPLELLPDYEPPESWPPPPCTLALLSRAVDRLLQEADVFYRSGDTGLDALDFRCRLAVATARRVYSSIGDRLRARSCDVSLGRAVVPGSHKVWCIARASLDCLRATSSAPGPSRIPEREARFPDDVLFV